MSSSLSSSLVISCAFRTFSKSITGSCFAKSSTVKLFSFNCSIVPNQGEPTNSIFSESLKYSNCPRNFRFPEVTDSKTTKLFSNLTKHLKHLISVNGLGIVKNLLKTSTFSKSYNLLIDFP